MEDLLKKIIFKEFKTKDFIFKELSVLGDAKVFLIKIKFKKYILRIPKKPFVIENNIYVLKKLKKLNISPKLISIGNINNISYSLETFLFGKTLSKLDFNNMKNLIENILKLHSIKNKKCGYLSNLETNWKEFVKSQLILKYHEVFKQKMKNSNDIIEFLLNNIPNCKDFRLLHGDLTPQNIIINNNLYYLFDFEATIYGEKEYDIAYLYYREFFSKENLEKIISLTNYDYKKILYYALCVGIRKIALSPASNLKNRIEKLQKIYGDILSLKFDKNKIY